MRCGPQTSEICKIINNLARIKKKSIRGWEDPENFYSHELISQRAIRTSLEKLLNPRGPIASRSGGWGGRSVPVFLKPITICDFPGGGGGSRIRDRHHLTVNMNVFKLNKYPVPGANVE